MQARSIHQPIPSARAHALRTTITIQELDRVPSAYARPVAYLLLTFFTWVTIFFLSGCSSAPTTLESEQAFVPPPAASLTHAVNQEWALRHARDQISHDRATTL